MILRKAVMPDVEAIYTLIQQYAEEGLLLSRSRLSLYENLQSLTVAEENGRVIGVAGLHILWSDLAEIRSLAIAPDSKGKGIGKQLVLQLIQEAESLGIARVFALTYQVAFFEKCGFQLIQKESLPQKVWKDCMNCKKFPTCDEIAMIFYIPSLVPVP
ncbi:acetyltransferase [Collibacillus ludicampi]|jgi:amino-acid N-acetyltransferase|uniref:Acetyltransferase n=1 Tax=Collibacillus ludicampi TaxID=2771369 RepID=A0AAV4LC68_9BACL|nr:N-acetyltransferase [Collibacillus ludicampi]GIM45415.1 acetyltransferase [Collibacillus ludicampi]